MRSKSQKPFFLNKVNSQAESNINSVKGSRNLLSKPMQGLGAMAGNAIGKGAMNAQMSAFLKKPSVAGANKLVKEDPSLASSGNPFSGKAGTGKVKVTIRK